MLLSNSKEGVGNNLHESLIKVLYWVKEARFKRDDYKTIVMGTNSVVLRVEERKDVHIKGTAGESFVELMELFCILMVVMLPYIKIRMIHPK